MQSNSIDYLRIGQIFSTWKYNNGLCGMVRSTINNLMMMVQVTSCPEFFRFKESEGADPPAK